MRFVLIPFAICLLLYIRQENQYHFRAATALKILLTMTLTVCLTVALVRNFSPVLLLAAVGMLLCAGGDFFLQRRHVIGGHVFHNHQRERALAEVVQQLVLTDDGIHILG